MYIVSKRLHNCRINYVGWSCSRVAARNFLLIEWNIGKFRDQEGSKSNPKIPNKMGLQRKVSNSLEESFQRTLPSYINMEVSLVHESSLLDEHRRRLGSL